MPATGFDGKSRLREKMRLGARLILRRDASPPIHYAKRANYPFRDGLIWRAAILFD
jgi:hypothetical protein